MTLPVFHADEDQRKPWKQRPQAGSHGHSNNKPDYRSPPDHVPGRGEVAGYPPGAAEGVPQLLEETWASQTQEFPPVKREGRVNSSPHRKQNLTVFFIWFCCWAFAHLFAQFANYTRVFGLLFGRGSICNGIMMFLDYCALKHKNIEPATTEARGGKRTHAFPKKTKAFVKIRQHGQLRNRQAGLRSRNSQEPLHIQVGSGFY